MPSAASNATHVYDALAAALHRAEELLDHRDVLVAIERFGMVHIKSPYAGATVDDRFEYRDAEGDMVTLWQHLDCRNTTPRNKFVLELHRANSDRHRVTKVSYSIT